MARVTHVKKARQRFKTVPVLNEDGTPKRTPVKRRDGTPKMTGSKNGRAPRPITMAVTEADKTQPLPNLRCDFSGCTITDGEIQPGQAYKHITPRSGPYGGTQKNRHAEHPSWQVWEYSYSRRAQVARTQSDMHDLIESWEPTDESDFDDVKGQLADMAQEQMDDQEDALSNMPEGLQDGSAAQENLEALESWYDEIDQADAPGTAIECETCGGTGEVEDEDEGDGTTPCTDCDENRISADWIEEAKDNLREAVDGCEI